MYTVYLVITLLENATHMKNVFFTDSTFLSEYFSMVNLLITIYFGHTDAKWCITGNRVYQQILPAMKIIHIS